MIEQISGLEHFDSDLERAEYLQQMLVARATGGTADDFHYTKLRTYFLEDSTTQKIVPSWIKTCRNLSQFWGFIKGKFGKYDERRQFIWSEFNPLLDHLESVQRLPPEETITSVLRHFDEDGIHIAWQKALERKSKDPEGAITLSRSILESVCKHILDEKQIQYDSKNIELNKLYKLAAQGLNLSPNQHSEKIFKQILGGCSAVVNGLGSLRNRFGDAHGQGKRAIRPKARHAEFAVNLAGSMALFLVETFNAQKMVDE